MLTLFKAIFAFDRLFRRTPSIIEIRLPEFVTLIPLGLALCSRLTGFGALGCPPAGVGVDGSRIGIALSGLFMAFSVVRGAGQLPHQLLSAIRDRQLGADGGVNNFAAR